MWIRKKVKVGKFLVEFDTNEEPAVKAKKKLINSFASIIYHVVPITHTYYKKVDKNITDQIQLYIQIIINYIYGVVISSLIALLKHL